MCNFTLNLLCAWYEPHLSCTEVNGIHLEIHEPLLYGISDHWNRKKVGKLLSLPCWHNYQVNPSPSSCNCTLSISSDFWKYESHRHSKCHGTNGDEPLLSYKQLPGKKRNFQHFVIPQGSLMYSQGSATDKYSVPKESSSHHPVLIKINFNILLLSIHVCAKSKVKLSL